jgi:hypothetical protein
MDDGVVTELIAIPVDRTLEMDTAEQVALGIIRIAQQRNIKPQCR